MGNVRNSLIPFSEVLNTIFQYEQSIGRSDDESWVDSDLLAGNVTLRPELESAYRKYSQKCIDYLRFGYEVEAA